MMSARALQIRSILLCLCLLLTACADKQMNDLHLFVQNAHKGKKPRIEPLPRIQPHATFVYTASKLADPFAKSNLVRRRPTLDNDLAPDPTRRKEPLEQFPLDALRMVGTLQREDIAWAVIRAPDGTIHRAGVGNYLGQNYGKISVVKEAQLDITELIPGTSGGWMERKNTLAIVK